MSQFSVKPAELKTESETIRNISQKLGTIAMEIDSISSSLMKSDSSMVLVRQSIRNLSFKIQSEGRITGQMAAVLASCAQLYISTEQKIKLYKRLPVSVQEAMKRTQEIIQEVLKKMGIINGGKNIWTTLFDGDPVNMSTGNYTDSIEELTIAGPCGFLFIRNYNAMLGALGVLGIGWTHNYQISLTENEDFLDVTWGDQKTERFHEEDGRYISNFGGYDSIEKTEEGFCLHVNHDADYDFDAAGKPIRIRKKDGNEIDLVYDGGVLVSVKNRFGDNIRLEYNEDGLVESIGDHAGRNVRFSYDTGFLTEAVSADGLKTSYEYDDAGRLCRVIADDGTAVLENTYDDKSRIVRQAFPDNTGISIEYKDKDIIFTDQAGRQTVYRHDDRLRISEVLYPAGKQEYRYNDQNQRVSFQDMNGGIWEREYDARGSMIGYTDSLGNRSEFTYDDRGNRIAGRSADGLETKAEYDEKGNLTALTDPSGNQTRYFYTDGLLTTVQFEDGTEIHHEYDEKGRLCCRQDECGNREYFAYDEIGRIICRTDACGGKTRYSYDAADRILEIINPAGEKQTRFYEHGRLVRVKDFDGFSESWQYDTMGRPVRYQDKEGRVFLTEYDAMSNPFRTVYPDGVKVERTYDEMNRVIRETGTERGTVERRYDPNGNCISENVNGHLREISYDAAGHVVEVKEEGSTVRRFAYDTAGHVTRQEFPDGSVFRFFYTPDGQIFRTERPERDPTMYSYDGRGRLTGIRTGGEVLRSYTYYENGLLKEVRFHNNTTLQYRYDGNGNLIARSQDDGYTLQYSYDPLNRKIREWDNAGRQRLFAYDASGNMVSRTDANGNTDEFVSSPEGRLLMARKADGSESRYRYDCRGFMTAALSGRMTEEEADRIFMDPTLCRDGKTRLITWERDVSGNILKRTDAAGNTAEFTYNTDGTVHFAVDENGMKTEYCYDRPGHVSEIHYEDGRKAAFEYDLLGRMTRVEDWTGVQEFSWDPYGMLKSSVSTLQGGTSKKICYERDLLGRMTGMTYPDGSMKRMEYNAFGQLKRLCMEEFCAEYQYDPAGRISEKIVTDHRSGISQKEILRYLPGGLLKSTEQINETGKTKTCLYTYDFSGNIVGREEICGSSDLTEGFEYDKAGRLIRVSENGKEREAYEYDLFGNCIMAETSGRTEAFQYNALNELISRTVLKGGDGQTTRYVYDKKGSCIEESGEKRIRRNYDGMGRLISVMDEEGNHADYLINSLGLCVGEKGRFNGLSFQRELVYDQSLSSPRIVQSQDDEETRRYLWEDRITADFSKEGTGLYSCDERGSVRSYLPPKGLPRDFRYSAFGVPDHVQETGAAMTGDLMFGFAGMPLAGTGTFRSLSREYDPRAGRFLSRDKDLYIHEMRPDSLNQYQYCFGNPILWIDPDGTDCYIFYLPEWKNEAVNDRRQLAKQYGYSEDQVHLIPVSSDQDFTNGWNSMGTVDGHSVDIDTVIVNTHGNPNVIGNNGNLHMTSSDVSRLQDKDMDGLILLGCNNGHKDSADSNIANAFAQKTNGAPVLASDGTVQSGLTFFNQTKRSYSSKGDKHYKGYRPDGSKRKNSGWVVYQEENGRVTTQDVNDKKMHVTDMVKELDKHPKKTSHNACGGRHG